MIDIEERETHSFEVLRVLGRCLKSGEYSDIKVAAFGSSYSLHKLILSGSGFFRNAFQWSKNDQESTEEISLDIDGFSREAFELCVAVLYGYSNDSILKEKAMDVMIMAQYLDIPEIVDICIDWVVQDLSIDSVSELIQFSSIHSYQRLTDTCVALLSMNGWEAGIDVWRGVPIHIIAQILRSNWFFVPSEWHRCLFLLDLIKLHEDEDHKDLLDVLNNDIMFYHFSHDQLLNLSSLSRFIHTSSLKSALWNSVQLQRFITAKEPYNSDKTWSIPIKDETLSGLIPELASQEMSKQTNIPPFRFSVAFADVSDLPPNKRIYSKTFWYMGSFWNVYLQKSQLASTGRYQIGIYLHRANSVCIMAIPSNKLTEEDTAVTGYNCGSAGSRNGVQNKLVLTRESVSTKQASNVEAAENELESVTDELSKMTISQVNIPYEDRGEDLGVYFSFYTPSRSNKPEITSFFSVPNKFSVNQSWGWKSNNLCQFTSDGQFLPGDDDILKFIVVLGQAGYLEQPSK